jgi:hypothetical protein
MRFIAFFSLFVASGSAAAFGAAGSEKVTPVLSIFVEHHLSTQSTTVSKDAGEWICKTELASEYPSVKQPFQDSALDLVRATKGADSEAVLKTCDQKEKVTVVDYRGSANAGMGAGGSAGTKSKSTLKKYYGCGDQPGFKQLISDTAKFCGRL